MLDLFCGAGGAAMGYHRAGFEVVGVDLHPQPNYPFRFIQADAMQFPLQGFDAIHASPPCQRYSMTNNLRKQQEQYPDLVAATRERLEQAGVPWVIENVPGAPLRTPMVLCGEMFGLRVIRHRLFELPFFTLRPLHVRHSAKAAYGYIPRGNEYYTISGHYGDFEGAKKAMGIDWMSHKELAQAIPPAYTAYIGGLLMEEVNRG